MYSPHKNDIAKELDVPCPSFGAPNPMILATDNTLKLTYDIDIEPDDWDGKSVKVIGTATDDLNVAEIIFEGYYAHSLYADSAEYFPGLTHLARNLRPYGKYEVESYREKLFRERENPLFPVNEIDPLKFFLFSFHDCTFLCKARGFTVKSHISNVEKIISRGISN